MDAFENHTEYNARPAAQVVKVTRVWPIVLAAMLSAMAGFSLCFFTFFSSRVKSPEATTERAAWESKLTQINKLINQYFIGEVDEGKLADAAAAGMIEGLGDEWSYYIPAEEYATYQEAVTNSYVGIGVTITSENVKQGLQITDVTPDSPAYAARLEVGDLIVAVEGVPVLDGSENALDLAETKNRVRGKEGTDITLTISHNGEKRDVTITRARIKTVNVSWQMLDDKLALIHIRNFEQDAAQDAISAIEEARTQGAAGLIFDVRFNPGGYKSELVKLLDYLLPEGPLFHSIDSEGNEKVDYSDAACLEIPMAVLANYESYSAAEFFAAALQEYGVATVIGEQTYGKGRFQTAMKLDDGSAINISIGQYTTPNGVSLVGKGITPDILVELGEEQKKDLYYSRLEKTDDAQLQKAIEVLTN
ncbi:MAG: S41 family peptidase [Oscillospiraceae bacterium]|nr:S41 family peptidase [Oscillospiraceae bacterium]